MLHCQVDLHKFFMCCLIGTIHLKLTFCHQTTICSYFECSMWWVYGKTFMIFSFSMLYFPLFVKAVIVLIITSHKASKNRKIEVHQHEMEPFSFRCNHFHFFYLIPFSWIFYIKAHLINIWRSLKTSLFSFLVILSIFSCEVKEGIKKIPDKWSMKHL